MCQTTMILAFYRPTSFPFLFFLVGRRRLPCQRKKRHASSLHADVGAVNVLTTKRARRNETKVTHLRGGGKPETVLLLERWVARIERGNRLDAQATAGVKWAVTQWRRKS